MNFKTFFLFIIFTLSSNSYAQWWQSGGNLIWPYGDVEIVSGDLSVQSYPLMPYSKVIWLEFRTDVVSEYDYYQYVSILKTIGFDNYDDSTNWVDTIFQVSSLGYTSNWRLYLNHNVFTTGDSSDYIVSNPFYSGNESVGWHQVGFHVLIPGSNSTDTSWIDINTNTFYSNNNYQNNGWDAEPLRTKILTIAWYDRSKLNFRSGDDTYYYYSD